MPARGLKNLPQPACKLWVMKRRRAPGMKVSDGDDIEPMFCMHRTRAVPVAMTNPTKLRWTDVAMSGVPLVTCTLPFLKKLSLRGRGGYISSPCRLRSTQRPPGRSMGVVDSRNAPGLNSLPSACGRSARGWREAAFGGTAWGPHAAHREPPQTRLGPWPPRSPGPLGHPPPAIPVAGWA